MPKTDHTKTGPATLYLVNELFGTIRKVEAREAETWIGPYAQYARAVHCHFTPKGARRRRAIEPEAPSGSLLVLSGWGHPAPASLFGDERETGTGVRVSTARHGAFSSSWRTEFDAMISAYLAVHPEVRVVADFRTIKLGGSRDWSVDPPTHGHVVHAPGRGAPCA